MNKLGILVGEKGLWTFFRDIYKDLSSQYRTTVFRHKENHLPLISGRVNGWLYRRGILSMLKRNDACFFEWASELLEVASHMPKYSPVVVRLHSFELDLWVHKINWDHVDRIIFVSDAMRKKFIERYGDQAGKSVLVYNGVSLDTFRPGVRRFDFSLGMLCTIMPLKRIYESVLMIRELRDDGFDAKLHIAGSPPEENKYSRYFVSLQRLVEKLELKDSVRFYGYVENPATWLQNIDVFISNSYWEGMQTALLEAMASGCFCLSHFWDGVEEVLPPENIYGTDRELKQKLIEYSGLSERDREEQKRRLTQIIKQKFNLEDKKVAIREVINSVL